MVYIDSTEFGSITINGKPYGQVLIIGEKVIERDEAKLESLFGTTHYISQDEANTLLSNNPELIIIGSGTSGVLKVTDNIKEKIQTAGVPLKILLTSQAVKEFNTQVEKGTRVNALIHTTC